MNFIIDSPTKRLSLKASCDQSGFLSPTEVAGCEGTPVCNSNSKQTTNGSPVNELPGRRPAFCKPMQLWADKLNDEAPCIDSTGELHRFQGAEAQLQGGWNEIQPYRSEVFARVRIPGPSSSKGGTTSQCLSHGGDNGEGISPSHNTPSDHSRVEELCELPEHADKLYCSKNL